MARCGWCWNDASTTTGSTPCVFCGRIVPWEKHGARHVVDINDVEAEDAGGGGSGLTVDNGVDAPVAVTGIVAPGATFQGDVATLAASPLTLRMESYTIAFDTSPDDLYVWNTPGLGLALRDMVEGEFVYDIIVFVAVDWDTSDTATIRAGLASDDLGSLDAVVANVDLVGGAGPGPWWHPARSNGSNGTPVRATAAGAKLFAAITTGAAPDATQGSLQLVAVIATPA